MIGIAADGMLGRWNTRVPSPFSLPHVTKFFWLPSCLSPLLFLGLYLDSQLKSNSLCDWPHKELCEEASSDWPVLYVYSSEQK